MATVVHTPKDTRLEELGQGVASYLGGLKEKRLDALQQEFIDEVNKAPDEASAAAILTDPRFKDLQGERFEKSLTLLNQLKPQEKTLLLYDPDGNQVAVTYDERQEDVEDVLAQNPHLGLNEPQVWLYNTDKNPVPRAISGYWRTREEAMQHLPEGVDPETATLLNTAQAEMELKAAQYVSEREEKAMGLYVQQLMANYEMGKAVSPFGKLADDRATEKITEEEYQRAFTYMTTRVGRSEWDTPTSIKKDLLTREAAARTLSKYGIDLINAVIADPGIVTTAAGLDTFLNNFGSELKQLSDFIGRHAELDRGNIGMYGVQFDKLGFAERTDAFKNAVLDLVIIFAAANDQKGRGLSNEDFDRFRTVLGADIRSPESFIYNMSKVIDRVVDGYEIYYKVVSDQPFSESGKDPIPRFDLSTINEELTPEEKEKRFYKNTGIDPNIGLELPPPQRQ